jgi:heme A synthase
MMTENRDNERIMLEFRLRQARQFFAIAAALLVLLFLTLIYKRPDIFGEFSKNSIFSLQAIVVSAFLGFTAVNWRCPLCNKYLGPDINRRICRKCRTRLR